MTQHKPIPDPDQHYLLSGMSVIAIAPTAVYLRLPSALQRPIDGGCQCRYCQAHPNEVPSWDTLGVPTIENNRLGSWTLHAPEWTASKPHRFETSTNPRVQTRGEKTNG
jgi:hypothetical protein